MSTKFQIEKTKSKKLLLFCQKAWILTEIPYEIATFVLFSESLIQNRYKVSNKAFFFTKILDIINYIFF